MRALDTKVWRDVARMRGQLLAIALVVASGIALYVGLGATMHSLLAARGDYYARERFAHVFASLVRAPEHVAERLAALPGVERAQTRVLVDVTMRVPGASETATGRLLSLPEDGRPLVNDLRLRSGRLPAPRSAAEVVVNEAFLLANRLQLGDTVQAVIEGRWQELAVVGTALSPEFIYTVGPGQLFPDDRRFGVLWMRRDALAAAVDMDGAFNDVCLQIGRGVSMPATLARVDRVLAAYGGVGAVPRADQVSAFFVENEITQLRTFTTMLPGLFFAVAAFLLHIVIGRVVAAQREQIAALKALGYRDLEVGLHFAKLVGVVVATGCVLGLAVGAWLAHGMTQVYLDYYRFPSLPVVLGFGAVSRTVAITAAIAVVGAWGAVWRTVRLQPAEAMRPEAPAGYRPTWIERLGLARWTPFAARMVLRELERRPWRAVMTTGGIAMATALVITTAFLFDSVSHLMQVQFGLAERADARLTLIEPRGPGVLTEIEQLPGVRHAEAFRLVPVRLRAGWRSRTTAVTGLTADTTLHGLLDVELRDIEPPPAGLVLSGILARRLGVTAGDRVRMEIQEGARTVRDVAVARVAETWVGVSAYMRLDALCELLGETPNLNGAWCAVDAAELPALHRAVIDTPAIAGLSVRETALRSMRTLLRENLGRSVVVTLLFSLILAAGVLYNTARITVAERARELASLRVLGFRRREVSAILLGELGILVALALPVGLLLGHWFAALLVNSPGFVSDQFRLPLVIAPATDALAVATVLVAAVLSAWSAWRRLDSLDIVQVLKTRD